jgi:hypothetical protein
MRFTPFAWIFGCVVVLAAAAASTTPAVEPPLPSQDRLYAEFSRLFRKYYPDVVVQHLDAGISFEYRTRIFMVHESLKTGEWQEAHAAKGPVAGGILCGIHLRKGQYFGAAVLPQTFDVRYFKTLVMAPYSSSKDLHLHVSLTYPTPSSTYPIAVNQEFEKEFFALCRDFDRYLD